MLLAVDIGNSNIKFGIFDADRLLSRFSVPTTSDLDVDSVRAAFTGKLGSPIRAVIGCSVVPNVENVLTELLRFSFGVEPVFVRNDFDFGLAINYEPRSAAGTDRLVNSFAAAEKYGVPCIVCSFGTATTIDVVNGERVLLGGIIAPGMEMMSRALRLNTAQLPEVEIVKPDSVIANTTIASIQSGIFYGYLGMVEGTINRIKKAIGEPKKVIATGGFAPLIAENTDLIDAVDENLLLDGLRQLHELNRMGRKSDGMAY